ncbi:MAG TPA: DUF2288 domain-containing protein [Cyanothece sp. UBA12306]|nr:DUF2288 domain-containing protein [Cyanothece sp. UBA12306]
MQDLKTRLNEDLAEAQWQDLIPHAQRDAIIIVTDHLDLLEVAVAIAQDDTDAVQHWISEALISKPSPEQLTIWNSDTSKMFKTLIVQPFVVIQAI